MVDTIKFSQMMDGGDIDNNKKVPGLKQGANVLFNNPWTFLAPGGTAQRPVPAVDMYYRLRFNTDDQLYEYYDAILGAWTQLQESLFTQGPFVIYTADPTLPDGQNLGALANGILKQTISLGVATLNIAVNEIDYYGPGMAGYLQAPAGVRDGNSNIILQFQPQGLAVNAVAISNAATTAEPGFNAIGSDTNIGLGYAAKGSGIHKFYSTAEIPFQIRNGTGYQRVNQFRFEDVPAGFTYTFPQATGTIALTASSVSSIQGTANQVLVNGTSGAPVTGTAVILTTPQDIGTTSSPRFNNVTITGNILDADGNALLHFAPTPSAVNCFGISNVATGNIPVFAAFGTDTNVSMGLNTQGTGVFNLKSAALTNQVQLNLGTSYNSIINHNYPSNNNTRTYTWQDASGTVAFLSDIPGGTPSALTRTNDTNVTLTLGGTPATALLQATSLTLGWTGTLSGTRGGTGVNNGSNTLTLGGNLTTSGAFNSTFTMSGLTSVTFPTSGTLATTSQLPTPAALTRVDDTNVTLTLGGTPATSLLQAVSLTLGWTGQLSLTRGGSNANLTASNGGIVYSTASAMAILAGTATQGLTLLSGASSAPTWSTGKPITRVISQNFTASGTYTPTSGMQYCVVEVQGGGGAGGGSATAAVQGGAGGGGGSGGYARSVIAAATIGASQTVTIGAAGSPGAAGNNAGGSGGTSSLGALMVVGGGTGGSGSAAGSAIAVSAAGGAGGTATTGNFLVVGQPGAPGVVISATLAAIGGKGGDSLLGLGGLYTGASLTGSAATGYGAGGSGGMVLNGSAATAGGAGTAGYIRITEYVSI